MARRRRWIGPSSDCPKGLLAFWNEGIEKNIPIERWRRMAARKFCFLDGKPLPISHIKFWEETYNLQSDYDDVDDDDDLAAWR